MRYPRLDVCDVPMHIVARGNNRQTLFHSDDDRRYYLAILRKAKKKFSFLLHAYCLMTNHIHLLLEMKDGHKLARLMHWVQVGYASFYAKSNGYVGHVFQSRYYNTLIHSDQYLLAVDRYVHLNPVKAGIVRHPEDYRWSSYNSRFTHESSDFVDQSVLDYFGSERIGQRLRYSRFVEEGIPSPEPWTLEDWRKIRRLGSPVGPGPTARHLRDLDLVQRMNVEVCL